MTNREIAAHLAAVDPEALRVFRETAEHVIIVAGDGRKFKFTHATIAANAPRPQIQEPAAMDIAPAAPQGAKPPGGFGMPDLMVMVPAFLLIFYFLMWRPQARERKNREAMFKGLKKGDRVLLSCGLIGEMTKACKLLRRIGPPADRLWAVEPTGVLTIRPSQL